MKTYIDCNNCIISEEGARIPKVLENSDYIRFLQEIEDGKAQLIPYTPPVPTWEEIRNIRSSLLAVTDWVAFPDVTHPNKQAWLNYRQALRDIPQNFTKPEDVIWPTKPE